MPLPLIVPALVAASGLFGIGKGVQAVFRNNNAHELNEASRELIDQMSQQLEHSRDLCGETLAGLGRQKVAALSEELGAFVEQYGKLKNVQLDEAAGIDLLHLGDFSANELAEMSLSCSMIEASALGLGSGAAGGALTAFGAYSGTMMLASAGTGTAISALSGAAATNATLAWLGGGTLASGGLGMAGGTMVLGVLAVGPALLVFGSLLSAKAGTNLENARSNCEQAKTYAEEVRLILSRLEGIYDLAVLATDTLAAARRRLAIANDQLAALINVLGDDYQTYNPLGRDLVFKTVKTAQLVKALVDTPILDADGNLLGDSAACIGRYAEHIASRAD